MERGWAWAGRARATRARAAHTIGRSAVSNQASPSARRVLVTGASRGIGRAVALELAREGFDLALNYVSSADAARAVQQEIETLGRRAMLLPFDVADRAAARGALESDVKERGAFWGVVLNAGRTRDGLFAAMDDAAWDDVLRTNLDGFFNVVRPLVMPMVRLRSGGRIVAVSSVSGVRGNRGQVNYSASKAGLIGAARSLALELASRGITVNCICPGFVRTDMLAGLDAAVIEARVPLGRLGEPEEVAALARFLFGERAAYLTGQAIGVDGGLSA